MTARRVRSNAEALGDDAVTAATGQPRAYWFDLLDTRGAIRWTHKKTAEWLVEDQGVDGWWAQSITVAYEQARGLRAPGQRADGSFEANASKTIAGSVERVYALVADAEARARWLDPALPVGTASTVLGATPPSSVRLRWPAGALGAPPDRDGRVVIGLYPAKTAKNAPKVRVGVGHGGLETAEVAAQVKALWAERLAALAALAAERGGHPSGPAAARR